jgi:hypothetical protein
LHTQFPLSQTSPLEARHVAVFVPFVTAVYEVVDVAGTQDWQPSVGLYVPEATSAPLM